MGNADKTIAPQKKAEDAAAAPTFAERVQIVSNASKEELAISLVALPGGVNEIKNVTILTGAGKEVYNKHFSAEKVIVNLNDLPSGMFLIKVNGEYAGKVVKN